MYTYQIYIFFILLVLLNKSIFGKYTQFLEKPEA